MPKEDPAKQKDAALKDTQTHAETRRKLKTMTQQREGGCEKQIEFKERTVLIVLFNMLKVNIRHDRVNTYHHTKL